MRASSSVVALALALGPAVAAQAVDPDRWIEVGVEIENGRLAIGGPTRLPTGAHLQVKVGAGDRWRVSGGARVEVIEEGAYAGRRAFVYRTPARLTARPAVYRIEIRFASRGQPAVAPLPGDFVWEREHPVGDPEAIARAARDEADEIRHLARRAATIERSLLARLAGQATVEWPAQHPGFRLAPNEGSDATDALDAGRASIDALHREVLALRTDRLALAHAPAVDRLLRAVVALASSATGFRRSFAGADDRATGERFARRAMLDLAALDGDLGATRDESVGRLLDDALDDYRRLAAALEAAEDEPALAAWRAALVARRIEDRLLTGGPLAARASDLADLADRLENGDVDGFHRAAGALADR